MNFNISQLIANFAAGRELALPETLKLVHELTQLAYGLVRRLTPIGATRKLFGSEKAKVYGLRGYVFVNVRYATYAEFGIHRATGGHSIRTSSKGRFLYPARDIIYEAVKAGGLIGGFKLRMLERLVGGSSGEDTV